MMRHKDGTVHFSDLKMMSLSPAHYRQSVLSVRETTRAMRLGTLVDMLLLTTKEPIVAGETRSTSAYKAARARHKADVDIFTDPEVTLAEQIVRAVQRDPLARDFLGLDDPARRTQVPLRWELQGVPRSTRGVDVITKRRLVDLKVTNSTHPDRFAWHARRMHWHCQLADYREACAQNRIDISDGCFLVGVESTAPFCTTVLHVTEATLVQGDKELALWIEKYKACEHVDEWPSYSQAPVELDVYAGDGAELVFPGEDADADAA